MQQHAWLHDTLRDLLAYARLNDLTHITAGLEAAMAALQQDVGAPQSGQ